MNLYTGLTIGELSRRTGIGVSALRAWERRYGFPIPQRAAKGHRRYREDDVRVLLDVVREREEGATLEAALRRARTRGEEPRTSVFAALRHALPSVAPVSLTKPALLAISRAIEDEATMRSEGGLFVGGFQAPKFWRPSLARWQHIATRAELVVALGAARRVLQRDNVWVTPLPRDSPVGREWIVVCDAPAYCACLAGVERVGQDAIADRNRVFDVLWTVEPMAVRAAARAALGIAQNLAPSLGDAIPPRLDRPPIVTYDVVHHATALTNRVLARAFSE